MDYKIVKYCRICRKRFLVERGKQRRIYCEQCQKKVSKQALSEE